MRVLIENIDGMLFARLYYVTVYFTIIKKKNSKLIGLKLCFYN